MWAIWREREKGRASSIINHFFATSKGLSSDYVHFHWKSIFNILILELSFLSVLHAPNNSLLIIASFYVTSILKPEYTLPQFLSGSFSMTVYLYLEKSHWNRPEGLVFRNLHLYCTEHGLANVQHFQWIKRYRKKTFQVDSWKENCTIKCKLNI